MGAAFSFTRVEARPAIPRLEMHIGPCDARVVATGARDVCRVVDHPRGASLQLCSMTILPIATVSATVHAWAVPDRCGPGGPLPQPHVAVTYTFTTAATHIGRPRLT